MSLVYCCSELLVEKIIKTQNIITYILQLMEVKPPPLLSPGGAYP